jgi:hypothetical protein
VSPLRSARSRSGKTLLVFQPDPLHSSIFIRRMLVHCYADIECESSLDNPNFMIRLVQCVIAPVLAFHGHGTLKVEIWIEDMENIDKPTVDSMYKCLKDEPFLKRYEHRF